MSLLTNNTEDVVDSYIAGIYDIVQMVSAVLFALVSLIYIDIRMIVLSLGVGILYLLVSGKLEKNYQAIKTVIMMK